MKVQELATIIANMASMAGSLGQLAQSAHTVGSEKVVRVAPDSLVRTSKQLIAACNALSELIPDVELEFDDASHCNDE